ncbi:hypothetical protein MHY20_09860 [Helcobacillus sp. ACRRO]|uniref:hypothetical protein n=1 Tax=Helcobacillus sp. ACRRO TaxID=2918202 RepID=UPI001EF40EE5|nr:hypothetical protein [Helcobacillus sp. ACRRO]MCG7427906.1 hypothetical protein [Helcobacillus sp. ACRRO]
MSAVIDTVLDDAGVSNRAIREFVQEWATITTPERVQVVGADDDQRLIAEALDAGELLRAGEGRCYARSHVKDTARSEERTVVATARESDRGIYNNWRPAAKKS